jgi:WhiB family redox-sensing transcriptional regulator
MTDAESEQGTEKALLPMPPIASAHERSNIYWAKELRMNTEWMTQGNCRKVAWSVFFPRDGLGVPIAQKICATCHVSQTCLEYALENHINHGVWGGCSERERTRIQRRRRTGQAVGVG